MQTQTFVTQQLVTQVHSASSLEQHGSDPAGDAQPAEVYTPVPRRACGLWVEKRCDDAEHEREYEQYEV
jgi:hypothetical protein